MKRIESGPLQIDDDWPGLFIRGDDCFFNAHTIKQALAQLGPGDPMSVQDRVIRGVLEGLMNTMLLTNTQHPEHALNLQKLERKPMTKIACYDDDGIWGVGDIEAQARAEAEGFIREASTTNGEFDQEIFDSMMENIKVAPISDDLVNRAAPEEGTLSGKVTINYSDIPYMLNEEGVLVFDGDKAAADDDAGTEEFITDGTIKEPPAAEQIGTDGPTEDGGPNEQPDTGETAPEKPADSID